MNKSRNYDSVIRLVSLPCVHRPCCTYCIGIPIRHTYGYCTKVEYTGETLLVTRTLGEMHSHIPVLKLNLFGYYRHALLYLNKGQRMFVLTRLLVKVGPVLFLGRIPTVQYCTALWLPACEREKEHAERERERGRKEKLEWRPALQRGLGLANWHSRLRAEVARMVRRHHPAAALPRAHSAALHRAHTAAQHKAHTAAQHKPLIGAAAATIGKVLS